MPDETTAGRAPELADDGLARRMKALACTAPLHDLDQRKNRLDWADASPYHMAQIGLHLIDHVALAMDFDRGADHEQVIRRALPFAAAQTPDRDGDEHEGIARWVLENLINVSSVDRGFRVGYGTFGASGRFENRWFDFKLLVELVAPDGEIYLRASDEAINVLVGALDTDVESAQVAAEVKLDNLIKRGKLSDARLAAEHARYRTIQYGETLRQKLEATRRDVRSVDWEQEVPELIEGALAHVGDRFHAENAILENITTARDEADEPEGKRKAAELVDIVSECARRHTQLQSRLQDAGQVFRAEQDRQQFSGAPQRAAVDLFGQLLTPTLELTVADARKVSSAFFHAGSGLRVPRALNLPGLVEMLLVVPSEREQLAGVLSEPTLTPLPDPDRFTDAQWDAALALLDRLDVARRLSGLLTEARRADPDLPGLLALLAAHAFSPHVGEAVRHGAEHLLLAVDDGAELADAEFGGADLLMLRASLHTPDTTGAVEEVA